MTQNRLILTATVGRVDALRYTPAGIPVLELWLNHHSRQGPVGREREVSCELQAVMVGEHAREFCLLCEQGMCLALQGYLCRRSLRNPRLVLHIEYVEIVKGETNGSSTV